jgi:catechol 2,3-dioxygenase-like lactoylglutathione lyase family enzyme
MEGELMFANTPAFSGFAVPDLEQARAFYGDTLGIEVTEENGLLTLHLAGARNTLVYPKPDHAPANYTILNFAVDDIERAVDQLTERGVALERYEGFEQDERGISRAPDGPPIAWFTDPAGNILAVLEDTGS